MSIRRNAKQNTSPQWSPRRRNGQLCPRCHRFGTFAPNSIVCDRCQGALPLVFVVSITVVFGGER